MSWRVGVDTGGTFTDVCLYDDESKAIVVGKISSTPADPGRAVRDGVSALIARVVGADEAGGAMGRIDYFAHGTTVATNALLQGRGARTGLITSAGFRDLLELGRQRRPKLYDLEAQKPVALAPRDLRIEVAERVRYDGTVDTPLDLEEVRAAAVSLREAGVEAVSVCFLYSYLNPAHESAVRAVLEEELPGVFLSISHEVLPEFREYERLSTVIINSFIGPVMEGYLSRLRHGLAADGLRVEPKVTQSNGGVMSFVTAEKMPVRTVLSGPSTGVVGAARLSAQSGIDDIITFDMGGTSSDVALVTDARPTSATGMDLDGRPVRAPMLDINTVGAGGGSIAWIDDGGHLKVGPQSAGADPGPACYGRGTTEPTVTDANVVLGILNQESLLGGAMPIDASLSFAAVERLGARLGMSTLDTAQGIISVVTANMARAIRVISVQRGYDPADYALVAFGGAGPLHSARLAHELGMERTIIPQRPGALSALGMLMTDLRSDYTRTSITLVAPEQIPVFASTFDALSAQARDWFDAEGLAEGDRSLRWVLDVRYVGQNYEIGVEVPVEEVTEEWIALVAARFHSAHEKRYGYSTTSERVEAATFRVEAIGDAPQAAFPREPIVGADATAAVIGDRDVYLPEAGRRVSVPLYARDELRAGNIVTGPAVIEQYDTTALVLPGEEAVVDEYLMIVTRPSRGSDPSVAVASDERILSTKGQSE
ncbi:hydantoinase/oxoprolinase family protein [Labedella populi]|uniref:Hydantoinase/oxoprolinase family protein n=1 Tax=Labedella populi TaxID=2498850 RepID=A0A3S3ZFA2_9MICO|nr:hydantoinase/oxoprolinase family protein [Labedella populi]RWZ58324.1 hydantoinase/oxoprolinase family protein [Labedella populi]